MTPHPHIGSALDDLLAEDGTLAEVNCRAIKRVLAWQLDQAMKENQWTKTDLATRMGTSRSALDRLLDPNNTSITLMTMDRAAAVLGKRLRIEVVDP